MRSLSRRFGFAAISLLVVALVGGSPWATAEEPAPPVASPSPAPDKEATPNPSPPPSSAAPSSPKPSLSPQVSSEPNRWSGNSGAVYLGYSPIYKPQMAGSDRFNTGNVSTFEAGVELKGHGKIGFRYSKATVPSLEVYDPTTFLTTYTANASLTIYDLLVGFEIPLNEPYGTLGPVQLFLPINFGTAWVAASGGPYSFNALTFDSSFGFGAHIFTGSFLRADLSARYHFAVPITGFTGGSSSSPNANLYDPAGETMKAGLSGFEVQLGLAFLFPDSSASETPAADPSGANK